MTTPTDTSPHLLAFLHDVVYHPHVREALHRDSSEVPKRYGLSPAEQRLVAEIGLRAGKQDREGALEAMRALLRYHLAPALIDAKDPVIW